MRADEYDDDDSYPIVMDGKYAGVIGVGGLLLARIPEGLAQSRVDYQRRQTDGQDEACLLYTSPSPRDRTRSRMPSSA